MDEFVKEAQQTIEELATELGITSISEKGANQFFVRYCVITLKYYVFDVFFLFLETFTVIFILRTEFDFEVRAILRVLVSLGVVCIFSYLRRLKIYARSQDVAMMFIHLVKKYPEYFKG